MTRSLAFFAAAALLAAGYAAAQSTAAIGDARREAQAAAARAERLRQQATSASGEADRLRAEAEAAVADIDAVEAEITAAEAHLAEVERLRAGLRTRLAERQQPLVRLTAALQTMAQRPPALALARPGSVDEIVRVRALLSSAVPAVRERTAALRAEVAQGDRLRAEAGEALAALSDARRRLAERRAALAELEESRRRHSEDLIRSAFVESDRAIALTEEARALAAQMSNRKVQAKIGAALAALPGPALRPGTAVTRSTSPASYRIPVEGRLLTGTGEISEAGVHARGLSFATSPGAVVAAPRRGRIAYAGRFRSYGEVVIIDHGGGWTSTLTGLRTLLVRPGDSIAAGDIVGRSGTIVGLELRVDGQPRPIAPFLV